MQIKSFLKSAGQIILKVGMTALGVTSLLHGDPSGVIAISAAITAHFKDKGPIMPIFNIMAGNIDKAKNDPKENE